MTYIEPAKSFIKSGVFARGGQPEIHRTIGYPFFLSVMMYLFGDMWLAADYIAQLFIFALIFPSTSYIATSLFSGIKTRDSRWIFLLLMAIGVGSAYTGLLLTDQFFTSLLTAGIACGFSAIRNTSLKMMLLHIMLTGYAAQVRPTLSLFFVADFFFSTI